MNTAYALSFSDLSLVDGFSEAMKTSNTKVLEGILYTNGMDVSLGYEIEASHHRTLTGKVWWGPRAVGLERLDAAWLATGAASIEAHIEAEKDPAMRRTLREMNYTGTLTPVSNLDE